MVSIEPFTGAIVALLIVSLVIAALVIFKTDAGALPKTLVGLVASVLIVVCVAAPIILGEESDTFDYNSIEYNDYFTNSKIESVSGALELVTVGDETYVHADSVGSAVINFEDGSSKTVSVSKAPLHVFMFIGQSNSAYWAGVDPSTEDPVPYLGSSYYYGTDDAQSNKNLGDVTYSFHEMTDPLTGDAVIGGIDAPFAATLYNDLGWKTFVVNCAVSGSSITTWIPGETNYVYAQSLFDEAWNSIDLDLFTPTIESYIWIQGESNASMGVSTYMGYFLQMHDSLIDGSFTANGKFDSALISKVRQQNAPTPAIAQLLLARDYSTIYVGCELADTFTVSNGLMISDDLHYSQLGRNLIGAALGDYYSEKMV